MSDALKFTADIVAAHVSNNDVARDELPQLIQSVHDVLARAGREPEKPAKPTPAVSVRSSVTKVALICLECGKKQKTLKRHLKNRPRFDPGRISRAIQPQIQLPDGGTGVFGRALRNGEENWPGNEGAGEEEGKEEAVVATSATEWSPRLDLDC